jgi:hypothetical protein
MSRPLSRDIVRHKLNMKNTLQHIAGRVRRHCGRGMPRPYEEQLSLPGL